MGESESKGACVRRVPSTCTPHTPHTHEISTCMPHTPHTHERHARMHRCMQPACFCVRARLLAWKSAKMTGEAVEAVVELVVGEHEVVHGAVHRCPRVGVPGALRAEAVEV